ncbi:hypothetical protein ACWD26_31880 [Streptomyces sp. NPDC002787]
MGVVVVAIRALGPNAVDWAERGDPHRSRGERPARPRTTPHGSSLAAVLTFDFADTLEKQAVPSSAESRGRSGTSAHTD